MADIQPCPESPNCVSTDAASEQHALLPFVINDTRINSWELIQKTIVNLPRTKLVTSTDDYLHVEFTSLIFRFVDDVEIQLNKDNSLTVRSASRTGHSDFGANRKRVENIRQILLEQQLLMP